MTIDDLIGLAEEANSKSSDLDAMTYSICEAIRRGEHVETQVDRALDVLEKISQSLILLQQYYRSADEWEGERWK